MTTFTLQDLNLPTTADQAVEAITKEEFMEYGMNNPISISPTTQDILNNMAIPQAPEPQPSDEIDPMKLIEEMMSQFSIKLKLLATVISQSKAQPVEEKSSSNESLQECVSLTLQQADWFKDLIRVELVALDLEKIAEGAVESIVENEVESYFENRFDPSDHFDFDDATHDAVGDRIDDVVSDKIDDAVDAYLTNATISISK
jgi:hypothetical protein